MFIVVRFVLQPIAVMFIGDAVDCTKFTYSNPLVDNDVAPQLKPAGSVHVSDMNAPGLNAPRRIIAARMTAMISIIHACAIRYSMADCPFLLTASKLLPNIT